MLTSALEPDAGACNKVLNGLRYQHVRGFGERSDPGTDHDGDAANPSVDNLALASVKAGSNLETERPNGVRERLSRCTERSWSEETASDRGPSAGTYGMSTWRMSGRGGEHCVRRVRGQAVLGGCRSRHRVVPAVRALVHADGSPDSEFFEGGACCDGGNRTGRGVGPDGTNIARSSVHRREGPLRRGE